jgi:hypothetical protein
MDVAFWRELGRKSAITTKRALLCARAGLFAYGWARKYLRRKSIIRRYFLVNRVERRQQGVRWIALEPLDRSMLAGEAESEVSERETNANAWGGCTEAQSKNLSDRKNSRNRR